MYNKKLRFLTGKVESTPGTAVTITSSDTNYRTREGSWTPNLAAEDDKWATGDLAENESIPGEATADTTTKIKLASSAAPATAPDWDTWLQSCGFKRTVYGSTGQSWVPHTDNDQRTMSQWGLEYEVGAAPQQRAMKFKGMIGTGKLIGSKRVGPVEFDLNYKGAWPLADADIFTANRLLPVTPDTTVSERLVGSSLTFLSVSHLAENFEMDFGNELSPSGDFGDPSGMGYYWISDRKPRFKVKVPIQRQSAFDPSNAWKVGTVGPLVLQISTNWKLTIPRGQIVESKPADVSNKMFWDLTIKPLRNGTVDATMDPQAVWELLNFSKT
jgi:hypothetical protein